MKSDSSTSHHRSTCWKAPLFPFNYHCLRGAAMGDATATPYRSLKELRPGPLPPISTVIQAWHAEVTRFILFGPSQQVQQPIYKSKAFDDVALISNLYANVIVRGEVPKATTLRGSSQCLGDVFQKVKPWSLCLARVWSYQLLNNKWHYDDTMQRISMCTVMEWQLAKVGYGWSKGRQKLDEPQEVAERLGYSGS